MDVSNSAVGVPVPGRSGSAPEMGITVAGVALRSPVIAASGTFGYGIEFEDVLSFERIGAFVTKGLSREPMMGNPSPRIVETAAGMMNAIGLQNVGVRAFIAEKLPKLRTIRGLVTIANVFGFTIEDCVEVVQALNDAEGRRDGGTECELPEHKPWWHGVWHESRDAERAGATGKGGEPAAGNGEAVAKRDVDRADGTGGRRGGGRMRFRW